MSFIIYDTRTVISVLFFPSPRKDQYRSNSHFVGYGVTGVPLRLHH